MKKRRRWWRWLLLAVVLAIVAFLVYAVEKPSYDAAMKDTAANSAGVLARAASKYQIAHGAYPSAPSDMVPPVCKADCPLDRPLKDPWGFDFFFRDPDGVRAVCSAGPDHDPATEEDNICSKPPDAGAGDRR